MHLYDARSDITLKGRTKDKEQLDILLSEYRNCAHGYAYRDALSISLFTAIFGLAFVALSEFDIIRQIAQRGTLFLLLVGFFGTGILYALVLDLHKTISCKGILRIRMEKIEECLQAKYGSDLMRMNCILHSRDKSWLERNFLQFTVAATMKFFTMFALGIWSSSIMITLLCKLDLLSGTCSDAADILRLFEVLPVDHTQTILENLSG